MFWAGGEGVKQKIFMVGEGQFPSAWGLVGPPKGLKASPLRHGHAGETGHILGCGMYMDQETFC